LLRANPLAQFPTLVTPEGVVMTEMAGIALCASISYLMLLAHCRVTFLYEDLTERHGKGTPWSIDDWSEEQRAVFYRLMVFIPANVYPTITVIDVRVDSCSQWSRR
jgi:GST-like protein